MFDIRHIHTYYKILEERYVRRVVYLVCSSRTNWFLISLVTTQVMEAIGGDLDHKGKGNEVFTYHFSQCTGLI